MKTGVRSLSHHLLFFSAISLPFQALAQAAGSTTSPDRLFGLSAQAEFFLVEVPALILPFVILFFWPSYWLSGGFTLLFAAFWVFSIPDSADLSSLVLLRLAVLVGIYGLATFGLVRWRKSTRAKKPV